MLGRPTYDHADLSARAWSRIGGRDRYGVRASPAKLKQRVSKLKNSRDEHGGQEKRVCSTQPRRGSVDWRVLYRLRRSSINLATVDSGCDRFDEPEIFVALVVMLVPMLEPVLQQVRLLVLSDSIT